MLEQIIAALVASGVRFVVLGGVAATIHDPLGSRTIWISAMTPLGIT